MSNWVIVRSTDMGLVFMDIAKAGLDNVMPVVFIFDSRQKARNCLKELGNREGEKLRIKKVVQVVVE